MCEKDQELERNMRQWLERHGGYVHSDLELFAKGDEGDRRVVAHREIKKNDQLLLIPIEVCLRFPAGRRDMVWRPQMISEKDKVAQSENAMTRDTSQATNQTDENLDCSPILVSPYKSLASEILEKRTPRPSPAFSAALILMAEFCRGKESPWNVYLESLPLHPPEATTRWDIEEIQQLLVGTPLEAIGTPISISNIFNREVLPIIQESPDVWPPQACDSKAFARSLTLVQSRAFHLLPGGALSKFSGEGADTWLVPCADMLNHTHCNDKICTELQLVNHPLTVQVRLDTDEQNNSLSDDQKANNEITMTGYFSMIAQRSIEPEEEVMHSYGKLSDAQTLQTFGFIENLVVASNNNNKAGHNVETVQKKRKRYDVGPRNPYNTFLIKTEDFLQKLKRFAAVVGFEDQDNDEWDRRIAFLRQNNIFPGHGFELECLDPLSDDFIAVSSLLLINSDTFQSIKEEVQECNEKGRCFSLVHNSGAILGYDGLIAFAKDGNKDEAMGIITTMVLTVKSIKEMLDNIVDANDNMLHENSSPYRHVCAAHLRNIQRTGIESMLGSLTAFLQDIQSVDDEDDTSSDSTCGKADSYLKVKS